MSDPDGTLVEVYEVEPAASPDYNIAICMTFPQSLDELRDAVERWWGDTEDNEDAEFTITIRRKQMCESDIPEPE